MADDHEAGEESPISFQVKSSNDAKYSFSLVPSTTIADLKAKLSTSEYADVPPERQRLIYSGRVLKDHDTLATHKVKDGHTIHLVKSAASNQRPAPASQGSTSTATRSTPQAPPGVPSNIAAGTGNSPLAALTGARYAGLGAQLPGAGMFGPDGGMGPPPDTDDLLRMLDNPQFQSTMNEALQNPQLIDMMIQQNPMLRDMGPGVRQMMQSPAFRRMLTDPNTIRQMSQMQRQMGMNPMGGPGGGNGAFPAPGVTNTTPEENRESQNANTGTGTGDAPNPFAGLFGMPGAQAGQAGAGNPFAALFGTNPAFGGATPGSTNPPATGGDNATPRGDATAPNQQTPQNPFSMFNPAMFQPPPANDSNPGSQQAQNPQNPFANILNNPFLQDPALFNQVMQAMGGQNPSNSEAGANPLAAMFPGLAGQGAGSPAPHDNRPPEERYAEQLRQLNDMGFYEFERNIEALRRTGGSVQGAVEYLLNST